MTFLGGEGLSPGSNGLWARDKMSGTWRNAGCGKLFLR